MLQKKFSEKKIFGVSFDFWLVVALFLIYSLLFSLLSLIRHNHFQSQGVDFTTYDQALWSLSRFENPYSTLTHLNTFADRFRPIMIPLSALYFLTKDEKIILLFQAVILAAPVFPIWLLAKRIVPRLLAIIIAFLYIDFIGIQSAIIYDFHEMALLPFFLAYLFYFLERKKWKPFFLALIASLSVREHVGLLLSVFGVYIWLVKKNLGIGLITSAISLSWSILSIKYIMPALGQTSYASFLKENDTLGNALFDYLRNPLSLITNFFYPFEKIKTLSMSFLSFGFLPLVFLPLLPVILFQFASRFLDSLHPIRWTIYYHYSLELGVLLAVATIYASRRVLAKFKFRYCLQILCGVLLVSHLAVNITLNSALKNLLKVQFWLNQSWMTDTRLIISKIPADASVSTQNNLMPHLSHRREIYLLPEISNAEYVVFDLHEGQDNWNFYFGNLETTKNQFLKLIVNGSYKPIFSAGDVYLLKRQI